MACTLFLSEITESYLQSMSVGFVCSSAKSYICCRISLLSPLQFSQTIIVLEILSKNSKPMLNIISNKENADLILNLLLKPQFVEHSTKYVAILN